MKICQRGALKAKQNNEHEAHGLQRKVDKYEEDRIGKGVVARVTAGVTGGLTGGKAGYFIGAPDKDVDIFSNTRPIRNINKSTDQSEAKSNSVESGEYSKKN